MGLAGPDLAAALGGGAAAAASSLAFLADAWRAASARSLGSVISPRGGSARAADLAAAAAAGLAAVGLAAPAGAAEAVPAAACRGQLFLQRHRPTQRLRRGGHGLGRLGGCLAFSGGGRRSGRFLGGWRGRWLWSAAGSGRGQLLLERQRPTQRRWRRNIGGGRRRSGGFGRGQLLDGLRAGNLLGAGGGLICRLGRASFPSRLENLLDARSFCHCRALASQ